jgi:hypothetical protein
MSLRAVRCGETDPKEIRALMRRHVQVYTRGSLHAKALVTEREAVVGSANASHRSRDYLDEVALLVRDDVVRRHLRSVIESYCTEPVRPEYLKRCLQAYRPPKMPGGHVDRQRKPSHKPKLWFIGGLRYLELSDTEQAAVRPLEKEAEKRLAQKKGTEVGWIRYGSVPRVYREMEPGQWAVCCFGARGARIVEAPAQLIRKRIANAARGRRYAYLFFEVPERDSGVSLGRFRRRVRALVPSLNSDSPRTQPIGDRRVADDILSWWTPTGHWRS